MKKVLFSILALFTVLGTLVCLCFAILYQPKPETVHHMSTASISQMRERTVFYIEDLEVLKRYAFKTVEERSDADGQPEESVYYVYDASQPMDEHKLLSEYYVVKFADEEREYIASLTVSADMAVPLENTPVHITACVNAFPASAGKDSDQLGQLRTAALEDWAQRTGTQKANVTFGYQAEDPVARLDTIKQDTNEVKLAMGITGIILAAFSVWFVLIYFKKVSGF